MYMCMCACTCVCMRFLVFWGRGEGHWKELVLSSILTMSSSVLWKGSHSIQKCSGFLRKCLDVFFPNQKKKNPSLTEGEHLTLSLAASPTTETCPSLLCRMKSESLFFKQRNWEKDREEWAMQPCPLDDSMIRLCLHISLVLGKLQA